jgi:hypothetical protein
MRGPKQRLPGRLAKVKWGGEVTSAKEHGSGFPKE